MDIIRPVTDTVKALSVQLRAMFRPAHDSNFNCFFGGVVAINCTVFLLWRIRPNMLMRHFVHKSSSTRCMPLLLCTFSHRTALHLAFNMAALWSCGTKVSDLIGPANTLALYISAGATSSLISSAILLLLRKPSVSGLGASGAVMCLFAVMGCAESLDARPTWTILFVVGPFTAKQLLVGVTAFDVAGVLGLLAPLALNLGHSAHLGGVLVGVALWYSPVANALRERYQKSRRSLTLATRWAGHQKKYGQNDRYPSA
jgi:membrane associated rhomboid family serine protease